MIARAPRRHRRRTAFWLLASRRLAVAVMEPTADEPLLVACAALAVEGADSGEIAPGLLETATAAGALDLPHVAALDDEWCALEPLDGDARGGFEDMRDGDGGIGAGGNESRNAGGTTAWRLDVEGLDVRVSGLSPPPPRGVEPAVERARIGRRPPWRRDGEAVAAAVRGCADVRIVASRVAATAAAERFGAARLRLVGLDASACALLNLASYLGRASDGDVRRTLAAACDLDPLTAVSVAPDCEHAAAHAGVALAVPVGLALARFGLVRDA